MKNNECIISMTTEAGSKQIYRKDKDGWTQKSSKGIVRRMTAEQFLSHLLPALTDAYKDRLVVKVEKIKRTKKDIKMSEKKR